MNSDVRKMIIIGAVIVCVIAFIAMIPFYVVNPGYTAIHTRLGSIIGARRDSGIYFKMPIIDTIIKMPNGIQKQSIETTALSKDLQSIDIGIDVNYRYINEVELYKSTRGNPEDIILKPFCYESIKAILAQYTAEELIQNRHEAKEKIYQDLKERLKPNYIEFIEVNFSYAYFSDAFMHAVEDKQIAVQHAMMSKNVTENIKEKAIQKKLEADADAYAQQVKKQSATQELIQLKAIEKWNGVLPQYMSSQIPFIMVNK